MREEPFEVPGRRRRARGLRGDRRRARAPAARRAGDPRLPGALRARARRAVRDAALHAARCASVDGRRAVLDRVAHGRRARRARRARASNARGRSGTRGAATSRCTCSSRTRSDCSASWRSTRSARSTSSPSRTGGCGSGSRASRSRAWSRSRPDAAAGEVTDDELVERWGLLWPQFFLHEELASAPPKHVGPQCSIGTNASISAHFEQRTLELRPTRRAPAVADRSRRAVAAARRVRRTHRGARSRCGLRAGRRLRALPVDRAAGRRAARGRAVSLTLGVRQVLTTAYYIWRDRNAPRTGGDQLRPSPWSGWVAAARTTSDVDHVGRRLRQLATEPTTTAEVFEGATESSRAKRPSSEDRAARARRRRQPRRLRPRRLPVPGRAARLPGRVRRASAPRGRLRATSSTWTATRSWSFAWSPRPASTSRSPRGSWSTRAPGGSPEPGTPVSGGRSHGRLRSGADLGGRARGARPVPRAHARDPARIVVDFAAP